MRQNLKIFFTIARPIYMRVYVTNFSRNKLSSLIPRWGKNGRR
jgi:hypothetical protein